MSFNKSKQDPNQIDDVMMSTYEMIEDVDGNPVTGAEAARTTTWHGTFAATSTSTASSTSNETRANDELKEDNDIEEESTSSVDVWEFTRTEVHQLLLTDIWLAKDCYEIEDILSKLIVATTTSRTSSDTQGSFNHPYTALAVLKTRSAIQRETEIFYTLGGYSILVGIMKMNIDHPVVLSKCFQLFSLLCCDSNLQSGLIQHSVYANAIECVLESMNKHVELFESDFYYSGFEALRRLTYDEYDYAKRIIDFEVVEVVTDKNAKSESDGDVPVGGVDIVLNIMKRYNTGFVSSMYAQPTILAGCHVLLNLTYIDFNQQLIDAGGITVLGAALEMFKNCTEIQETAREAITEMI